MRGLLEEWKYSKNKIEVIREPSKLLGVDSTTVEGNKVGFSSLLEGQYTLGLESKLYLHSWRFLWTFFGREFSDQQISWFFIFSDFSKGNCWPPCLRGSWSVWDSCFSLPHSTMLRWFSQLGGGAILQNYFFSSSFLSSPGIIDRKFEEGFSVYLQYNSAHC